MYEYEARMHAYTLSQVDKERDMHMQAWLNQQVTATKGKDAKPAYRKFEDFFDYDKRIKELTGKKVNNRDKRMAQAFKRIGKGGNT